VKKTVCLRVSHGSHRSPRHMKEAIGSIANGRLVHGGRQAGGANQQQHDRRAELAQQYPDDVVVACRAERVRPLFTQ
jgi:hypothetical protein